MTVDKVALRARAEDAEIDREIRRLAWPAIAEMLLHMFVWVVDTAMVGHLGARALSAVGLGGNVYWTSVWIFSAVAIGTSAMVARAVGAGDSRRAKFVAGQGLLVGQNLGAKRSDRAMKVGYRSLRHSVTVMGSVAVAFFFMPEVIVRVFTGDAEVVRIASMCLRIAAFEQVAIGMTDTLCGSLRGAGDTRTALRITAIGSWLVRMSLIVLAIYVFKLSLPAVWVITCLDWAVRAVLAARHFRAGRWQEVRLH